MTQLFIIVFMLIKFDALINDQQEFLNGISRIRFFSLPYIEKEINRALAQLEVFNLQINPLQQSLSRPNQIRVILFYLTAKPFCFK